jgi:trehalose/maltose hydrolase-like predicted phosphorylase
MAAEVGHLDLAYDYAFEAALIDLRNLHHNTGDGLHMASLAGAWTALVAGFGGLRQRDECLCVDPALPDGMSRLVFSIRWRGARLTVDVGSSDVTFLVRGDPGASVVLRHAGEEIKVSAGHPETRPLGARRPVLPRPAQPPGREPLSARPPTRSQQ